MSSSRRLSSVVVGVVMTLGLATTLAAQAVPNRADAVEVRKQFLLDLDTLQTKFLALANAFPADKYAWRPAPGVRSVGEVFMHVASEFYVYNPMAYGVTPSPIVARNQAAMKTFEGMSSKPEVLKHLTDGFAYSQRVIGGADPDALTGSRPLFGGHYTVIETSFGMVDDLHEHLGQLIAYARTNGITPPWSK